MKKQLLGIEARWFAAVAALLLAAAVPLRAQTSAFTYQGRLADGANQQPTGVYQMQFALFDVPDGGAQVGAAVTDANVSVAAGVFTVALDFGAGSFDGAARYLEIRVFSPSTNAFVALAPRQTLTSAPYAIKSLSAVTAATATDALNVGGTPAAQLVREGDARLADARQPLPGNANYIQNQTAVPQASTSFRIAGAGRADLFDAVTGYAIGGARVLGSPTSTNLFAGRSGGLFATGANNSFFGSEAGKSTTTEFRAFSYNYLNEPDEPARHIGLMAQDVERFYPSLVTSGAVKTLNYAGLSVVALGAIREQQRQIETQRQPIGRLAKENEDLRRRFEQQEQALEALRRIVCRNNPAAACRP